MEVGQNLVLLVGWVLLDRIRFCDHHRSNCDAFDLRAFVPP